MRRALIFPCLLFLLLGAGCNSPSDTDGNFSIIGYWSTQATDSLDIRMTISETARAITGAGSWLTSTRSLAFRVSGAHVDRNVSLLFDFGEGADVSFLGEFERSASDSTLLAGSLFGGSYRGTRIVFVQRADDD